MQNKKKDKTRKTINRDIQKGGDIQKDEKKEKLQKRRKGGERREIDETCLAFLMPPRYLKTNKQANKYTNTHTLLFTFIRSTQITSCLNED